MDIIRAKELDKILTKMKPNGCYISDAIFKEFNLSCNYKEYIDILKKRDFIKFNHEASGPVEKDTGYYFLTIHGKGFKGFEIEFKKENNWFYKDNYNNLKWFITTIVFVMVNNIAWILTYYNKCK